MNGQKLVNDLADGTQEIQIGSSQQISTPIFAPEISGPEDLKVILDNLDVLDPNNPIIVPGFRWRQLRDAEQSGPRESELAKLISDYPILMYEPPELFRFKKGGSLVTYGLKSSRSRKTDFNTHLKQFRVEEALSILPIFFQDFARCQLSKLYKSAVFNSKKGPDKLSEIAVPREIQERELNLSPPEVWQYRINESVLNDYFISLIRDGLQFENSDVRIIPPVPPLRRSDDDLIADVFDVNETMLYLCDRFSSQQSNSVYPYLHIYVDWRVFADDSDVHHLIIDQLEDKIQPEYTGLSLTVSGYDQIWNNGLDYTFEKFVNSVNNICEENYIPLICPRSEYYGAYLSDFDVNVFSSLLRKHQEYYDQTGAPSPIDRYSKIPDIDNGTYLDILDVDKQLVENDELTELSGLAGRPDNYPPHVQTLLRDQISSNDDYREAYDKIKRRFGTDSNHRKHIGKPRWLGFVELANRFRNGRRSGQLTPAKNHLKGTDHPHLS